MELREGMNVRVLHTDYDEIPVGTVTHIVGEPVDGGAANLWCEKYPEGLFFFGSEFEPAPKFAVGDKVRCIGNNLPRGKTGVIVMDDESNVPYLVAFNNWADGHGDDDNEWWLEAVDLEPVAVAPQPQLRIQAGRYYKTRDGRKVGPMEVHDDDWVAWESPDCYYDENGVAKYIDSTNDLIAEWVDEPAVATVAEDKPKFKVGDRVENAIDGNDYETPGTVHKIVGDGYRVIWDFDGHEDTIKWEQHELRLVSPATSGKRETYTIRDAKFFVSDGEGGWQQIAGKRPAIVALIENGQPKPADRPFVHPDREAATKEARRLAGKHKGQEFGVYELVDTAKEAKVYKHEWQRLAASGDYEDAATAIVKATGMKRIDARRAAKHWAEAA